MRFRGLAVFFMMMMALAATPQVWQRLHDLAATAQNRAETEWWRVLMSFNTPGVKHRGVPQTHRRLIDTRPQLASNRPPAHRKAPARALRSVNPSFNATQSSIVADQIVANSDLLPINFLADNRSGLIHLNGDLQAQQHVLLELGSRLAPAVEAFSGPIIIDNNEVKLLAGRCAEESKGVQSPASRSDAKINTTVSPAPVQPSVPVVHPGSLFEAEVLPAVNVLTIALDENDPRLQLKMRKALNENRRAIQKLRFLINKSTEVNHLINISRSTSI